MGASEDARSNLTRSINFEPPVDPGDTDRISPRNWVRAEQRIRSQMPLSLILVISPDWMLLQSRCSILQRVGYVVGSAPSMNEAIRQFREGDFDLVILCHTFPAGERDRFTRTIRASGSLVPIVYLTCLADPAYDGLADLTVECSPDKLLSGVKQALMKAENDRLRIAVSETHSKRQ
jgi:CheY-like chemotaxis protein